MKKGIIAISLLLGSVLLVAPISNAISQNNEQVNLNQVVEENTYDENKTTQNENIIKSENKEITKSQAEVILNKYIKDIEQGDFTYTYKGDENTFEIIKEKGIRGYVFLPNIETDLAYLIDKENGSIYYFHPSGYFELLK